MPTYFVASGGSNTAPYETWAKAATSFATALAAATTDGDTIAIQHNGVPAADAAVSADTTWTIAGNINIISSTNSGTSTVTPTAMGDTYWLGTNSNAFIVRLRGAKRYYVYGLTLRNAGTATDPIEMTVTGNDGLWDTCYFWLGSTGTSSFIATASGAGDEIVNEYENCTFRFSAVGQVLRDGGSGTFYKNCTFGTVGTAPNSIYGAGGDSAGIINFDGCQLAFNTALVGNQATGRKKVILSNCVLPSAAVLLAAQTTYGNDSQAEVYVYDSAFGDVHYSFAHYTTSGRTVAVDSVSVSDGAEFDGTNKVSWEITTGSTVTGQRPYASPWIETYRGLVSTTPSIEGLRINNATVAQNDEVWAEFSYKGTASSVRHTFVSDAMAYGGTPANQTSAKTYSDWTATPATDTGDSVFKLDVAAFTPSEIGMLRARVCVGEPSITVYIDPKIRT